MNALNDEVVTSEPVFVVSGAQLADNACVAKEAVPIKEPVIITCVLDTCKG